MNKYHIQSLQRHQKANYREDDFLEYLFINTRGSFSKGHIRLLDPQ